MNLVMKVIRVIAMLVMIFVLADFLFKWKLLKSVAPYFIIFAIVYFFGSMTQMLIRLKTQHSRYAPGRRPENEPPDTRPDN